MIQDKKDKKLEKYMENLLSKKILKNMKFSNFLIYV